MTNWILGFNRVAKGDELLEEIDLEYGGEDFKVDFEVDPDYDHDGGSPYVSGYYFNRLVNAARWDRNKEQWSDFDDSDDLWEMLEFHLEWLMENDEKFLTSIEDIITERRSERYHEFR